MLRGAPPAAGPTGTVGRARATPELHGAVRSGTVGRGPNRDHRPWTGRGGFASTHAHLGTAGRETILGIAGRTRAGGAARPGAGNYASSYACLGTAGRETILGIAGRTRAGGAARLGVDLHVYACPPWHRRPRDPQGDRGLRAGRRSCVTRSGHNGCRRDASDRLSFNIFYRRSRLVMTQRSFLTQLALIRIRRCCSILAVWTVAPSIKDRRRGNSSVQLQLNRV